MMEKYGISSILVTDQEKVLKGALDIESVAKLTKKKEKDVTSAIRNDIYTTSPDTAVSDLLSTALATKDPIAVIDAEGKLLGAVDRAAIIAELSEFIEDDDAPTVLSEIDSGENDV